MYSIKLGLEFNNPIIELKSELQGKRFIEKSQRGNCFKMAEFDDLKIPQLKKEQEKRGSVTNGVKSELQSRLREAMEAENIGVDDYVFQLELEEETTKIEAKEEA